MKIAFPTQQDMGLSSSVYNHFGSAAFFVIVDTDTNHTESIINHDLNHTHGNCQPLVALGGKTVQAVVVGGIGRGALKILENSGIRIYRAIDGTVSQNLELIKAGKLPMFTMNHTCSGHSENDGCIH